MNPRLTAMKAEFDKVRAGIDTIEKRATDEGRDLTDTEQADVDKLYARADELKPEIESYAERERSISSTADILARLGSTPSAPAARRNEKPELPTAGEWFARSFAAMKGDDEAQAWLDEHIRELDVQSTTDAGTALPKPIVGDLLSIVDATRPVFSSFTPRDMPPKGKTFVRPRITQHVEVGEQDNEGDELDSRKMVLTGDDVTKRTVGGALELSRQDQDWTEPAALQLVVNDFVDEYAVWTEGAACDALETAAATFKSGWNGGSVDGIITSFTNGVQENYTRSKRMPTTCWLSLDAALSLAAVTNTDDSVTAIAMIKEALGFVGINLDFVVGPQLAPNTRILGNKLRVESYEQRLGLLQADIVGNLKKQIAYAGYVAFHIRPESVVGFDFAYS